MLVLPFNRTDSHSSATYALYGKLPNRPDFVRVNANHPVALEFDELVQRNLERLTYEAGWELRYEDLSVVDFQYISRDRRFAMIGSLLPSRDQAGRRYPLVAAAILPVDAIARYLPVSPIAYEVFYDGLREQLSNAIENSVEALACRQFLESHLRFSDNAAADLELAVSVVQRFMTAEPATRLDELLSGENGAGGLQQALLNIAFYVAFLRRFDNPATNQLLVLPLSPMKGERALVASVWLSLLSIVQPSGGDRGRWQGSYILLRRKDGATSLIASMGRMPESFVGLMLGGQCEEPMRLDLAVPHEAWRSHQMYPEVSYALGRLLADPQCRIELLYDYLQDIGKQLQ